MSVNISKTTGLVCLQYLWKVCFKLFMLSFDNLDFKCIESPPLTSLGGSKEDNRGQKEKGKDSGRKKNATYFSGAELTK